ncbi:MAG: transcription termination/antitermination protein NusG [Acidobacteriaceae bacterium]|nr:transcription termination/antitermination protein NusG [Acidobacteriaceae bacterium]MBV9295307.1 transcription termination/antitermination protein NusG [Acidobacteriaceae bacterium]
MLDEKLDEAQATEPTPQEEDTPESEAAEQEASALERGETEEPAADEADTLEEDQGFSGEEVHAEATTSEDAAAVDEQGAPQGPPKNWYIIHAYSGFEQKVAESLRSRAQAFGFSDRVGQILIPTEEVVELRNGKKVTSKRLLYPGYVLVEMEMDDELWHQVKSTPRVTGFVGGGTKPVPLTADEVNSVLYRQASSADRPRPKMTFEKSETVKIVDGPFTNFSGKVDEVNTERNTLRVLVTIFGRSTPVELDFLQVEKI